MYPRPLRLIAAEDLVYYTARLLAAILCRECCFLQEAVKSVNGRLIKRQFASDITGKRCMSVCVCLLPEEKDLGNGGENFVFHLCNI